MALVHPNLIGLLEDTYIQLFSGATLIVQNEYWALEAGVDKLRIDRTPTFNASRVLAPPQPCSVYTAIVRRVDQSVGIGIVEVFEVD